MRDKPGCQDLQKHLKEGRRDCWKKYAMEELREGLWRWNEEEMKREARLC